MPSREKSVLGWIGRLAGRRTAVEKSRENPVVRAAVGEAAVIYDRIPLCDFIDEERRSKLARELYLEIVSICNTTDPRTTCREQLVATMLWVASFQVLVIPPAPAEDVSGLRGQPGITGELKAHLLDIFRRNDELRSEIHKQTDARDFDSMFDVIQRRFWEAYWLLGTLNATRVALGDTAGEDWFDTFLHAACARQEHGYRWELELPPALDEDFAREAVNAYAVFADIVLSGAPDPLAEWNEYVRTSNIRLPGRPAA